jgi:ribosomal protein S18 acetylase RimI-like enzyme
MTSLEHRCQRGHLASLASAVPKFPFVLDIRRLGRDEWPALRDIRLTALQGSPDSFLSTYDKERKFTNARWRAEFDRGEWYVGFRDDRPASLLGVTREPETPLHQCFLEYVWVSPECRRSGVASLMLNAVLDQLQATDVQTAFLWVLDGNDVAVHLYKRLGFVSSNLRQPLADFPGRSEERMEMRLSGRTR